MIWGILAVAVTVRLININQSLWLDEAINVLAASNNSFVNMISQYPIGDFHPPGWFFILWIWERIGGNGEVWVRLPSVAFGVLTVWFVYLVGKELFTKKVALIGSLLMAIAPLHVYYSQEARMYSLAALSATMSFHFFWRFVNQKNKWDVVGYTAANILVLYSDYLAYFIIPTQAVYLFWTKNPLKKIILGWLVAIVALLPWLLVFPKQLTSGTMAAAILPGWANVAGGATFKELLLIPIKTFFGRVSIDNKQIYGLIIGLVGLLYGVITWAAVKKIDKSTKLLLCWIVIPTTLAFLISFFIPVLSYFRMLFILPAFYLLLAKGIDNLENYGKYAVFGVSLISLISLGAYYIYPRFQREDWKTAVPFIESRLKNESIVLLEDNGIFSPYTYYSNNLNKVSPGLKKIPAMSGKDVKEIPEHIKEIYLFEYLVDITDPERNLQREIERVGFNKVETLNFNGVGFVHHFNLK